MKKEEEYKEEAYIRQNRTSITEHKKEESMSEMIKNESYEEDRPR